MIFDDNLPLSAHQHHARLFRGCQVQGCMRDGIANDRLLYTHAQNRIGCRRMETKFRKGIGGKIIAEQADREGHLPLAVAVAVAAFSSSFFCVGKTG